MSFSLPTNQADKNLLNSTVSDLTQQNEQLAAANATTLLDIARALQVDFPFKKLLDPTHVDIFSYEEELRRLNGQTVSQPLQESGFSVNDISGNPARITVIDGRLKIVQNGTETINVPIIPMKGYSKSFTTNGSFNLWSRDSYGSSTSKKNTASNFTLDLMHYKLHILQDGTRDVEIDFSTAYILPKTLDIQTITATMQTMFRNLGANVSVIYNNAIRTFSIISGTQGLGSSIRVLDASTADMKSLIKFDQQVFIDGRNANNLLNVEVDGVSKELKLGDFRLCTVDPELGNNNDDMGIYWTGDPTVPVGLVGYEALGPLQPSGINNGDKVASSIQSQMMHAGFKDCVVNYFSSPSDQTFQIFSGSMGLGSSVRVLPASDPLRDARLLLGFTDAPFVMPREERGKETYYDTLGKLYDLLAGVVSVSAPSDVNRASHSILYTQPVGVNVKSAFQDYNLMTTKVYDDASRGWPRLYPNGKVTIDASNDKIDFCEIVNVEKTASVEHGLYENETFLAEAITAALNSQATVPNVFTCSYSAKNKTFIINVDPVSSFEILWQRGSHALNGIGSYVGFFADSVGATSYVSQVVSFSNPDYFNPVMVSQLSGLSSVFDFSVDEKSAINKERELLTFESVAAMQSATSYDNEILINAWEQLATKELSAAQQEKSALLAQSGAYANNLNNVSAESSDSLLIEKQNALVSVEQNIDDLAPLLASHDKLLNISYGTDIYYAGINFTEGDFETLSLSIPSGANNTKIYNKPAPVVTNLGDGKIIAGRFSPAGLFTNSAIFTLEDNEAFSIKGLLTGSAGYSYSRPGSNFNIVEDTAASVTGTNVESFMMSPGDSIDMRIDGIFESASFVATAGYVESSSPIASNFIIKAGMNDTLDFSEGFSDAVNDSINETFSLLNGDQLGLSIDGGVNLVATFSGTSASQTGGVVNLPVNVIASTNDRFNLSVDGVNNTVIVGAATYSTIGALVTSLQNAIDLVFGVGKVIVSSSFGVVMIESAVSGTSSSISTSEINGFLGNINFLSPITMFSTGNVADLSKVTADEVVLVLSSVWIGVTIMKIGSHVQVVQSATTGNHTIQISDISGTPNAQLGFSTSLVSSVGDFAITISAGAYDGASLATSITSLMNSVGGKSTYTVTYSGSSFNLVSNGVAIFKLLFGTGANVAKSIAFMLGFNSSDKTGILNYSSDVSVQFPVVSGINDSFDIVIDSNSASIIIDQGQYTSGSLVTEISNKLVLAFNPSASIVSYTGSFVITSGSAGTASNVTTSAGVNDFLQTILLNFSSIGSGNVLNIASVSAGEVATVLSTLTGINVEAISGVIKITTTSVLGSVSSIEFVSGACLSIFGFSGLYVGVDGNNKLKVNIDFDDNETAILLSTGTSLSGESVASDIQAKLQTIGTGGYAAAKCTYNETTIAQVFTNSLRIISGTIDALSSVNVSDKTIEISSLNNTLVFEEIVGIPLTITIPNGFYNGNDLTSEIMSLMNSAGTNVYTVVCFANKLIITSTGALLNLLFSISNIAATLGFYSVDKTGLLSYSGDGFVKTNSCDVVLGFDLQTIELGHHITSIKITITDAIMTGIFYWTGGSRIDLREDLTILPNDTVSGLLNSLTVYTQYEIKRFPKYLLGRIAEPFVISDGDTFSLNVNSSGTQTVVFEAKPSTSVSGLNAVTRVMAGTNFQLTLQFTGSSGTFSTSSSPLAYDLLTTDDVCTYIQQEVRGLYSADIKVLSSMLGFMCTYSGGSGRYILTTGASGTDANLFVSGSAAVLMKLGVANGGIETAGSGNVANNNFVSISEIISKLSPLTGAVFAGPNYLKITSTDLTATSSIVVAPCSLAAKLGFDAGLNDDSNDDSNISSMSLHNIVDQEVQNIVYDVMLGWGRQPGNVQITYSTIDNSNIVARQAIVTSRLAFIPIRIAQIASRINVLQSSLTPALYNTRKDQVKLRLNKKTGSYVKVGEKYNQIDNNNSTIDTNTTYIAQINVMP